MSTVAHPSHDIFLSHAGAHKDFTTALYDYLRSASVSTFMDIAHHSLPPGERFPPKIFTAARTCRMAVLVLSEEYVQSKWPMLELCAFLDAPDPKPKILPLFFKLSPSQLRDKENQKKWLMAWQKISLEDSSRPIDLIEWKRALKDISSHNGIAVKRREGEHAYIKRICDIISNNVSSSMKHELSGYQGLPRMSQLVLSELKGLMKSGQSASNTVRVLGMHGLPGSGKTSLCRFLCDDLFTQFDGKALLLELPTDPTDQQLLVEAKRLLQSHLTGFKNKLRLEDVSSIKQVYHMLKGTNFSISRVFLVIDNISSHESVDVVMALLNLGLGAGSVVLLVARTLDILHPLLQHRCRHQNGNYYVYGNMMVPSLNDTEALRVLLQLEDDSNEPEVDLSPSKRQVMEEVLSMCSNKGQHLPLVLKRIANQLMRDGGLERLKTQLEDIDWTEVWLAKEKALQKLLLISFEALSDMQRELFLDVALFIIPLYTTGAFASQDEQFSEACTLLGHLHGCSAEEVKFELRELQKQCFLTLKTWKRFTSIEVHDVYLEFADSIKAASRYFWSSGRRWSKVQREYPGILQVESPGLRTVVLELLNEQEYYEFPSEFSSVRAMVLRNCKSLRALGRLANLKSLASLEIRDCPSLRWVDQPYLRESLRQVKWVNTVEVNHHEYLAVGLSSWHQQCFLTGRHGRAKVELGRGLVMQMKALQVLQLVNTGIRMSAVIISEMQQLRELVVRERHIEHFHACNLPNLKRLLFYGDIFFGLKIDMFSRSAGRQPFPKLVLWAGCPQLEDVYVHWASSEGITPASSSSVVISARPRLKSVRMNYFWNLFGLADLNASADSLENLTLGHCQDIKSLAFGCTVYGNLTYLILLSCPNLIEVTGLERLPSLLDLTIVECDSLKSVSGLAALASLKRCTLHPVPEGVSVSEFANLTKLEKVDVVFTCPASSLAAGKQFNMRNLVSLRALSLESKGHVLPAGMLTGIEGLWNLILLSLECNYSQLYSSDSADQLADLATLLGVAALMPSQLSNLRSIREVHLSGLENLTSLNGIEFLVPLETLYLRDLPNLSCLRGIESLTNLVVLRMSNCASVEELPSLARLARLIFLHCDECVNLRIVHRPGLRTTCTLEQASFRNCKSLVHLPFDLEDLKQSGTRRWVLSIAGSKFASVEALVAWVQNEEVPQPLRRASLRALNWEFYINLKVKGREKAEMVLKLLHAVRRLALEKYAPLQNVGDQDADDVDHLKAKHHQHPATLYSVLEKALVLLHKLVVRCCSSMDCIEADHEDNNIVKFKEYWNLHSRLSRVKETCKCHHKMFPAKVVEEVLQQVASVPKEYIIRQCCSNPDFQLFVFLLYTSLYYSPSGTDESFCPECCRRP